MFMLKKIFINVYIGKCLYQKNVYRMFILVNVYIKKCLQTVYTVKCFISRNVYRMFMLINVYAEMFIAVVPNRFWGHVFGISKILVPPPPQYLILTY